MKTKETANRDAGRYIGGQSLDQASRKRRRAAFSLALLLAASITLLVPPAAAQESPKGEPVYTSREGPGYEVYADGSLDIGGDVLGSCDTVLEAIQRGPLEPTRETYRQVQVCEEAGFRVPGSEFLPETGGPSLPVVAALGLVLSCALCRLGTR